MADIFLSYCRRDRERVATVARGLEASGRSLWWDPKLASGGDYAMEIEREIDAASCVVVAWSPAARDSLWVRAEANAALDQNKIVQIAYDGARLPLPFTMLHFLDFSTWRGAPEQMPWPRLEQQVADMIGDGTAAPRQPGLGGGGPVLALPEPPLQGLERIARLGWAALAVAALVAVATIMVASGMMPSGFYGVLSIGALAIAAMLLAMCTFLVLRIEKASRR
jgi:TIR domain